MMDGTEYPDTISPSEHAAHVADAVIRELDLKLGCHGEIEGFLSERGQR